MFTSNRRSTVVRVALSGAVAALVLGATAGLAGAQAVDVSNNNVPAASNNQTPASACHNQVPVNALGVQVPVHEIEAAAGVDALNPGSESPVTQDESCSPTMAQSNDVGHEEAHQPSDDSVVAASNNNVPAANGNQAPVEACHNQVPVNALGVQVPVQEVAAAVGLALLSEGSSTPVTQDEACDPNLAQSDDVGNGDD